MATKDNNAGLLSKVARFVRNPTKDWADLDKPAPEPEQESGYSKQALKEMIERKRQNDFVRRREFDYLRKLRRNAPAINPDLAGRPSFFQSSLASNPDERATTLKKIDEIEAQMSKQWWKGKQEEAAVLGDRPLVVSTPPRASGEANVMSFEPTQASLLNLDSVPGADYESTQMGLSTADDLAAAGRAHQPTAASHAGGRSFDAGPSEFSPSKLFSIDLGDSLADPDLEDAAIRFANGDDAGAEAGLLAALQADNVDPGSADRWAAALFDLYRSTGQQASFDRVAIDHAQRFGRSAPAWFSTPDLLGHKAAGTPLAGRVQSTVKSNQTVWDCPAVLDVQAVQALQARLTREAEPWCLNWRQLSAITPDGARALAALFVEWCSKPVKLNFLAADILENTLRSLTPSGDKRVDPYWWRLRLDALRILRLQDEFELAALDYCVTYEVSPPPWSDARCEYVFEGVNSSTPFESAHGLMGGAFSDPADLNQAPTVLMGMDILPAAVVELTGEVLGDVAEALDKLQAGLKGADRLVVSCARLIRVDFSAAGSILNWVATRESEGCQVQFRDVPCLVAAFFNVIGINEHARVILRTS
ncbi:MAG: STAS domain-containing protein [Rhodoferax sp.]|uniref:STAS domain-containing protein n=1 Tax=Rhodoferax sp. TaxID=50421 RepID=UPI0017977A35|nr:STAS domain-containing protein [Rhodoferax sp.]NMM20475.1 STAS domain-containing protein [Rhodoferax sp.]